MKTMRTIQEILADNAHLVPTREPVTLIQTIDRIKALRAVADSKDTSDGHMPIACRLTADNLEADMERRLGWVQP